MEILFLNWRDINNPKRGGAEIILYELCSRLVKKGHNVTWFCTSFTGDSSHEIINGIKIIRKGNKFSVYFHAFFYYRRLLKKPDLVFDCINTICWQTPLFIEKKKRVLYANQSARKVFFYEYPPLLAAIAFLLEPLQYLTYKSTNAICYSESIKKDLISFGLDNTVINTFPLGIDHKRYKKGKKSKNPTFIFVARFVKNKRPALCVFAMKHIVKKYPLATFYFIGYGDEESNLQNLIKKLDLQENIFIVNKNNLFLEQNEKDVKVKLMQKAWALVLPSVKEGWGMVVTEAAACGTPSIVSRVTGLIDSVIHNKTGLVLSSNPTPLEIASAMERIIEDDKFRESLSYESLAFAKKFSWEKSFDAFYKILETY